MSDFVTLENVDLRYGGKSGVMALSGAEMSIAREEFAAVVGPSGCGKSSLMKLVTGLTPCTGGQVRVDGKIVSGPLKCVGMAFQNPTLLPWRKLLSNIMLPLEIVQPHRGQLFKQKQHYLDKARSLLKMVDLQDFEEQHPWELSGGMQQRANLCRALIHSPDLLMLDEPFGALDAFTREELWQILQAIWLEKKFTAILVTHDLREAAYLADVIYVMSARPGRVIAAHRVDLPRPRTLETTFEPHFLEIIHTIRNQIAQIREENRAA
jgi:NitT/TauT family transport system ATP-binding protein